MIYFIGYEKGGPSVVRIGYIEDSARLAGRIRALERQAHWGLSVVRAPGGRKTVEALGALFEAQHMRGETYELSDHLRDLIDWCSDRPDATATGVIEVAERETGRRDRAASARTRNRRRRARLYRKAVKDGTVKITNLKVPKDP